MNRRYATFALAVALVVPGAAATAASASAFSNASVVKAAHGDSHGQGRDDKSEKPSNKRKKAKTVVYNGTLTAVDAGSITIKVRGGRDKKLRNSTLTLAVAEGVKVSRNGKRVALTALQVGDRVNVQTRQTTETTTVTRVTAKGAKATPEPTEPTETVEPEPTQTPEPDATQTPAPDVTTPADDDSTPDPTPTA